MQVDQATLTPEERLRWLKANECIYCIVTVLVPRIISLLPGGTKNNNPPYLTVLVTPCLVTPLKKI